MYLSIKFNLCQSCGFPTVRCQYKTALVEGSRNPQVLRKQSSGNKILFCITFFEILGYLISWPLKMGTDRLSRNVGKELPLYAA